MTNKTYDRAKWVAMVALPALATFYAAVAAIWGWSYTVEVVGTITALNALLGALLGISSITYSVTNDKNTEQGPDHYQPQLPTNFGGTNEEN